MRKLFLLTGCVWTMLFTACDNTDYSDHSPFDNSAYLSVAETRNVESFTFNRRVTEQAKKFTAKLTYPVGVDVTVRLQINPSLADAYNADVPVALVVVKLVAPGGCSHADDAVCRARHEDAMTLLSCRHCGV